MGLGHFRYKRSYSISTLQQSQRIFHFSRRRSYLI
ncbi:Protein of unknown function [Bacillus mycoides]|nr:Protein of unknown function [Bacillus mycoides]